MGFRRQAEFQRSPAMLEPAANATITLDISTLFVVATCVTILLGLFLLFAWIQDRVHALAWWGTAYLIGGFSVAAWSIEGLVSPPLPSGTANALLFVACGMMWNAARLFHGHRVAHRLHVYGIRGIDRGADHAELGHCLHLYVPDRDGTLARAPQAPVAEVAGDFRADAARRCLPVSDPARERTAIRQRHRGSGQRMDCRLCDRDHAL